MYSEISFPSLGIALDPPRSITLGPLSIHFYGMIIAMGLVLLCPAMLNWDGRTTQISQPEENETE